MLVIYILPPLNGWTFGQPLWHMYGKGMRHAHSSAQFYVLSVCIAISIRNKINDTTVIPTYISIGVMLMFVEHCDVGMGGSMGEFVC